ncbi:DNA circularization N-terminal domain-containing protein [Methylomonas sp. MS20]|uniref:DNA circularization N-terminal domain-containing protein n=1 Tax=unclassified Methylomonas TaxID=2608980 RepID=UPI0028A553B7|nr:DNA circularization N-terminal domain-containing protein [Methylomonas sp. MV1]MDT4328546.1 DNA circularization N-terminal domain-containing protein [Methylomonas sp. MV1]
MAETYRDRWEPAQFRDQVFLTDAHTANGGRRLAVHEFPGAEEPLVEDLGGKAGRWQVNAYFLADRYDLEVAQLIETLNTPGADWLVHPWLGRLWVRALSWSRSERNQENGFATLQIEFVPGGEQPPEASADLVDVAGAGIDGFADAAVADFDLAAMSSGGLSAFVAAVQGKLELVRQVIGFASLPLTWSSQIQGLVGSIKTEAGALMSLPGRYAGALRGLTDAIGFGADRAGLAAVARPRVIARVTTLAATAGYTGIGPVLTAGEPVSGVAATDPVVRANLAADGALRSRLCLAAAMQLALTDYATEADRAASVSAIDAVYDALLPTLPDAVFQAAVTARTALVAAVLAQDLRPLQSRSIVHALPSTLLAHRMQVDEAVLIARNAVRHPLFVQGRVDG